MALTTKGRATRQRIVEGAAAHLRSGDPGEVTLDEIGSLTGTSRGQLFHYFPGGKDDLLLSVAEYEAERVIDDQQPHLGSLTSWAAWDRWRTALIERYRAQGGMCPLASLMNQLGSTPGAAQVVATLQAQWQAEVRKGIEAMQASGRVRCEVDADRYAAAILAGVQGGVQMLRATGDTSHLEAVLDLLIAQLRGG